MRTLRPGTSAIRRCHYKPFYRSQWAIRRYTRNRLRIIYQNSIKLAVLFLMTVTTSAMMMFVSATSDTKAEDSSITVISLNGVKMSKEIPASTAITSSNIITTEFTRPILSGTTPEIKQLPYVKEELDPMETLTTNLGKDLISVENNVLRRYDLPNKYYPGIDFSSFQPYMDYRCITNKSSPAYAISHSSLAYTDEYGMRRYQTTEDQFTIDGNDDYVIALGTFYKEKGVAGTRYLIVTSTGMYTAITGDEKADSHTDSRHMFSLHQDGTGGIIEWIVDQRTLETRMRRSGTITAGPIEPLQGEILHIYGIQ